MFIVTAKLPKRRTLLFGAGAIAVVVLVFALLARSGSTKDADDRTAATNEERIAYLESLGWEVAPEPLESLELTLPDELSEPYLSYNAIQLRQGFDLTPCCGKTLTRYTYSIQNYPDRPQGCQADLYLCGSRIVAGDIVCTGADGFLAPLAYPKD